MEFNIGDKIEDYGIITRITKHSVWINNKLFKKDTLLKNTKLNIISRYSIDADTYLNWTDPSAVDKYYKSFMYWKCPLRMGDNKTLEILEVKDNKIYKDDEYYLPYYNEYDFDVGKRNEKTFMEDCIIFGYCLKKVNNQYDSMGGLNVNVFYVRDIISNETIQYNKTKKLNEEVLPKLDYLKGLDLAMITNDELDALKENVFSLYKSLLPYTINKVTFKMGDFNRIEVHHRNKCGYLQMNNGYKGRQPFDLDYYAILKVSPYFTNECQYTDGVRLEEKQITFKIEDLEKLSHLVVKIWDKAIKNNARNI